MKSLTALFAAAALTLTAGLAQADVRPDQIPSLLKSGQVMDFQKLNAAALAKHPGATITDTELDHKNGVLVYEVDITDTTGKKFEVKLDAKTGTVLEDKQDT
ncbi:PepSY domain-containing protein [Pseudomonas palleroniana]|uniref:Peptidase M4 n=1 Tax=Pseudomonas palleroniana TaxID=191390 RepID=A0A1H5MI32_9PSED|nr:PepSY domain-containing protein [Pseudomonas palleroniana]KAB0568055.1 peptidase M4 [Pseudomonas palleroniana]PTC22898.1 peptidase M4 [Pseudomonas palleroniana]UOP11807.1 PepSY domain-containing protein [Pseudomonas palleroniana]SEE88976.1 Peptidase propeptide and YPEB domain-containing protein [Pseudomonas palleroniana]